LVEETRVPGENHRPATRNGKCKLQHGTKACSNLHEIIIV
jgi:hypothetical protein